jgi:hypothetical protein
VARWRDAIERFIAGDARLREALMLVMHDRPRSPGPGESAYREYFDRALAQAS